MQMWYWDDTWYWRNLECRLGNVMKMGYCGLKCWSGCVGRGITIVLKALGSRYRHGPWVVRLAVRSEWSAHDAGCMHCIRIEEDGLVGWRRRTGDTKQRTECTGVTDRYWGIET